MSFIRLNNLYKSFEDRPILRQVFLRISQGDRVGLIGKNGAGKTALLKLILNQEEPTDGTVEIDPGLRISHDRFFIDKIATQLMVFEGAGQIRKVNGNWTTWRAGVE